MDRKECYNINEMSIMKKNLNRKKTQIRKTSDLVEKINYNDKKTMEFLEKQEDFQVFKKTMIELSKK